MTAAAFIIQSKGRLNDATSSGRRYGDFAMSSHLLRHARAYLDRRPQLLFALRVIRFAVLIGPLRPLWIWWLQRRRPMQTKVLAEASIFPQFDVLKGVRALHHDGFAPGLRLPQECVGEALRLFGTRNDQCFDVKQMPYHIRQIAEDPKLVDVARQYLGAEPILLQAGIWRTRAGITSAHGSRFHFDVCDVKSATVFFYLTDVGIDGAAHVVIRGTHQRKSFWQLARIYMHEALAERKYGQQITPIFGPRGTGFFEEQTIFHKVRTGSVERVVLSISYSLARQPRTAFLAP